MRSKVKLASVMMVMMLSLVLLAGCSGKKVTLRRVTYEIPGNYNLSSQIGSDTATYVASNGFEDGAVLRFKSSLANLLDDTTFDKECLKYADSCLRSTPEVSEFTIVANSKTQWLGMPAVKFTANAVSTTGKALVVEGLFAYDVDNNAIYNIYLTRPASKFGGDFDSILNKAKLN
jgi:hypothetical protein